jgi:ankyrin repeat protein
VARLLLERGAEVDRTRKDGATPLGLACKYDHDNVEQLLRAHGAQVNEPGADSESEEE